MKRTLFYTKAFGLFIILLMSINACSDQSGPDTTTLEPTDSPAQPDPISTQTAQDTAVATIPPTPTKTPAPLAARVNGFEITLQEYQDELTRFQSALDRDLNPEDETLVLDDLINQVLLAQAAAEQGYVIDESKLQERIDQLVSSLGSEQELINWMDTHGYSEDSFQHALSRSISAAWMRDQVVSTVPRTMEQILARQILLTTAGEADEVYTLLQAGNDFRNLALEYDPLTGGDLGWFPRGYLFDELLEGVVFELGPDEYSQVVETQAGFHIVQVLKRDPARLVDPNALLILQGIALQDWVDTHRSQSDIQILIP
jgi:peptidyl-prolyl cis-trans isomerase C